MGRRAASRLVGRAMFCARCDRPLKQDVRAHTRLCQRCAGHVARMDAQIAEGFLLDGDATMDDVEELLG